MSLGLGQGWFSSGSWNPFKKPDPKELVRKWQAEIRKEMRAIDRQLRDMKNEEKKAIKLVKQNAARGDLTSVKILAKEVVTVRRTIGKLSVNKATMISLSTQLTEQLALVKVSGSLSKSTEVMKLMNDLIKLPQVHETMRDMAREMFYAGMVEEMTNEAIDSAIDEDGLEEEAEEEVDKILLEATGETLAQLAAVPTAKIGQDRTTAVEQGAAAVSDDDEEQRELERRLATIRST